MFASRIVENKDNDVLMVDSNQNSANTPETSFSQDCDSLTWGKKITKDQNEKQKIHLKTCCLEYVNDSKNMKTLS